MTKRPLPPIAQQLALLRKKRKSAPSFYRLGERRYSWTGFQGKTFWDWLQIAIIPLLLAALATILAARFNSTQAEISLQNSQKQHETDLEVSQDQQRQDALVAYQKDISDLLLIYHLRSSQSEDEVRSVARARTLSTLGVLNPDRKRFLIQFLYEARLIADEPIVSLKGANLTKANLIGANLDGARLDGADLEKRGSSNWYGWMWQRVDGDEASGEAESHFRL